jgi:hypothetical protein
MPGARYLTSAAASTATASLGSRLASLDRRCAYSRAVMPGVTVRRQYSPTGSPPPPFGPPNNLKQFLQGTLTFTMVEDVRMSLMNGLTKLQFDRRDRSTPTANNESSASRRPRAQPTRMGDNSAAEESYMARPLAQKQCAPPHSMYFFASVTKQEHQRRSS